MYQLAELSPLLLCDPRCQGDGGHSSGLGDGNDPLSCDAPLVQVLGDLSGLPRASLPWRVSCHNMSKLNETCDLLHWTWTLEMAFKNIETDKIYS